MLTIKPYLDKDGSHLRSETQFGSNTISEWSYYFEADRQADGEVPENKVIWLPINAKDFVTALKDVTSKSFDTMVSMLGITPFQHSINYHKTRSQHTCMLQQENHIRRVRN